MDYMKNVLQAKVSCITPNALIAWDMKSTFSKPITQHASVLMEILCVAMQTECANRLNTLKDYSIVCSVIISTYMPNPTPGLLGYDHVACETVIKLQSLLFYSVPLDKWCIMSLYAVESTCISMCRQGHSNCMTSAYPLLWQHQYQYIDCCRTMIICTCKGTIWDISCSVFHSKCKLGWHATCADASMCPPSQ